jgi:molecular chaperone GrpE
MSGKKMQPKKPPSQDKMEHSNEEILSPEDSAQTVETLEALAREFHGIEQNTETTESNPDKEALIASQKEVAQLNERILRLNAEMENMRRRHQKERSDAQSSGIKNFASDMANVLDNLYRGLESISDEMAQENEQVYNLRAGVDITRKAMEAAFERYKIKRIDPLGELFNHDFHQAISQVDDTEKVPGTVIQVVQPGYTIEDRLLRPALVVVSK